MAYSALILAYCLGSLSFAVLISKFMQLDDPRGYGSKNAGATNVMRSGNKKAAALTLLCDLLKGSVVVWIAQYFFSDVINGDIIIALCGVFAVLGHIYPLFFKFKGGKGVATAAGVMLGFSPLLAVVLAVTWFTVFKFSKISSLSAVVATLLSPLYIYFITRNIAYFGTGLVIAFFVLYKHRENITRIINGQEHKFKKFRE